MDVLLSGQLARIETLIRQLQGSLADLQGQVPGNIRRGAGTITYPNSAISNSLSVTHGLGATPVAVVCTWNGGTATNLQVFKVTARTSTTFTVAAISDVAQTLGATVIFDWIALA